FFDTDGHLAGVIVAGLSLDWLGDYISRKGVPEGASLAIADRNGVYLARYPDSYRFVGTKMPGNDYHRAGNPPPVHIPDLRDVDDVERIVGYSTLDDDSGGMIVSFGLNKALAFAQIQHRTQQEIILIVLSMTLILLLAWLGAQRFIHRPVSQLVEAANQWSV